jgi:hypothetical protein
MCYTGPHGTHVVPHSLLTSPALSHGHLVTHISRPFACFLPHFALLLKGPSLQTEVTEPPSRHMRLALRSIADTLSFLLVLLISVLPDSLARRNTTPNATI